VTTEESGTERLMNALINKMESMDRSLDSLKQENLELKKMIQRPGNLLKRAGFVSVNTPLSEGVEPDNFRADLEMGEATLLKGNKVDIGVMSNEDVHQMSWDDIHELADNTKNVEVL
jgi:environmental stress-induced protein Ves